MGDKQKYKLTLKSENKKNSKHDACHLGSQLGLKERECEVSQVTQVTCLNTCHGTNQQTNNAPTHAHHLN